MRYSPSLFFCVGKEIGWQNGERGREEREKGFHLQGRNEVGARTNRVTVGPGIFEETFPK